MRRVGDLGPGDLGAADAGDPSNAP